MLDKLQQFLDQCASAASGRKSEATRTAENLKNGFETALTLEKTDFIRFLPHDIKDDQVKPELVSSNGYRDKALTYDPLTGLWQIGLAFMHYVRPGPEQIILLQFAIHFEDARERYLLKGGDGKVLVEFLNLAGHADGAWFYLQVLQKVISEGEMVIRSLIRDRGHKFVLIRPLQPIPGAKDSELRACVAALAKHVGV